MTGDVVQKPKNGQSSPNDYRPPWMSDHFSLLAEIEKRIPFLLSFLILRV